MQHSRSHSLCDRACCSPRCTRLSLPYTTTRQQTTGIPTHKPNHITHTQNTCTHKLLGPFPPPLFQYKHASGAPLAGRVLLHHSCTAHHATNPARVSLAPNTAGHGQGSMPNVQASSLRASRSQSPRFQQIFFARDEPRRCISLLRDNKIHKRHHLASLNKTAL